jgi:hypothetical protein
LKAQVKVKKVNEIKVAKGRKELVQESPKVNVKF